MNYNESVIITSEENHNKREDAWLTDFNYGET